MRRHIPHTVSFREITGYTVTLDAANADAAIAEARRMCATLSPAARAGAFTIGETLYEDFAADPALKTFRVTVEAKAVYEIDIEASDADDAIEKAEDRWNSTGTDDFAFEDFFDVHFEAEEEP